MQTLGFTAIRAIFVRRFGFVRPCPFQKRFKQANAAAFFRAALERLVESVISSAQLSLTGPLAQFADVRLYDGTGQRVPPRGCEALPGCTKGKAGSKWVVGYSIKTGLLEHAEGGAETASETPLWHKLVPSFTRGVLYLFDLGFFERKLFAAAQDAGAHVLMRLKKTAKVRVMAHIVDRSIGTIPGWSLGYYLTSVSRRRGTLFDLDVVWGKGKDVIGLRLVGIAHTSRTIRWYLTTVPRSRLSARQIVQAYRLRWLIELLFRGRQLLDARHQSGRAGYGPRSVPASTAIVRQRRDDLCSRRLFAMSVRDNIKQRLNNPANLGFGLLALAGAIAYGIHADAEGIPSAGALVYSGVATNASGAALASPQDIEVRVFDAVSGGTEQCAGLFPATTLDDNGRFQVTMPDSCVGAISAEPNLWVQIKVGTTTLGRAPIGAVPYAVEAKNAARLNQKSAEDFAEKDHHHDWADLASGVPVGFADGVDNDVPSGAVLAFDLAACPSGWTALDAARGRAVVGVPAAGSLAGTVGSALTNLESRAHSHSVNPAAVTSSSNGAHNHTIDPADTATTFASAAHTHTIDPPAHHHQWGSFNNSAKAWTTWNSSGSAFTLVDYGDGIGNEGEGDYPVEVADNALPSTFNYYTQDTDQGAFTSASSSSTSHAHSVDIASTSTSIAGDHSHTVDVTATTSTTAGTADVIPYIQLLYCRKN